MNKIIEPELSDNQVQLTSNYRLSVDKLNKTLSKRYQKKASAGKNAKLINEWGYGEDKYYGSWSAVGKRLAELEFEIKLSETEKSDINSLIKAIELATETIEKVGKQIAETFSEKLVLNVESKRGRKSNSELEEELIEGDDI